MANWEYNGRCSQVYDMCWITTDQCQAYCETILKSLFPGDIPGVISQLIHHHSASNRILIQSPSNGSVWKWGVSQYGNCVLKNIMNMLINYQFQKWVSCFQANPNCPNIFQHIILDEITMWAVFKALSRCFLLVENDSSRSWSVVNPNSSWLGVLSHTGIVFQSPSL